MAGTAGSTHARFLFAIAGARLSSGAAPPLTLKIANGPNSSSPNWPHVNRVSTLGELAASISYELNQPVAGSILNASLALHWLEHEPADLTTARGRTRQIIEGCTLASEIIDRLRSLYKKEPPKREPLAVNEIIGDMVELLRGQATRHAVSVHADLANDLPYSISDRVQVLQVLMNLMLNGIEAMSDTGGVLTVRSQLR
jgi:C4-dicarboxylate-specific signal transduction histidine kinase